MKQGSLAFLTEEDMMISIYTPTELAILHDYFKLERPKSLKEINVYEECAGIFIRKARYSEEYELSNAVARIALKRVQNRLPVWACVDKDGDFTVARTYEEYEGRAAELFPLYLFMINWADSGPGFSWPEAYYLVWLPEIERYVVTASQDSPDCYGFEDIVIGDTPFNADRKQVAKDLITGWWESQHNSNNQPEWECLFGCGFVSEDEAYSWRDEVWTPYVPDEDEE